MPAIVPVASGWLTLHPDLVALTRRRKYSEPRSQVSVMPSTRTVLLAQGTS